MKLIDLKVESLIWLFCGLSGIYISISMYFYIAYLPILDSKAIISLFLFILVVILTIASLVFLFESISKLKRELNYE